MSDRHGFTVVEWLMAVIVATVLISLVGPPITRSERRLSAYVAASGFRSDVVRARQQAILGRETVRVVIDPLTRSYHVEDGTRRVVLRRQLRNGLTITTTAYDQTFLFSPRGTSSLYSTTWISVAADPTGRRYGLRVSPSGSIESR